MKAKASLWRCKDILAITLRHLFQHALQRRFARWPTIARHLPGQDLPGPKRFRQAIEEIGGTFIKFGQMLAMQSDLLPLDYCAALFSLFDRVPPLDYSEVERTFTEDLQRTPQEIFDSFDIEPIATGSIGQVHVARLRDKKVAVKVRRPTIISDFQSDIAALKFTVRTVRLLRLHSLFWIIAPAEEFIAWTEEELDFRREAHYMDELGRNAQDKAFEKVPVVFWSCTTARILTIEFLEGVTISEFLREKEKGCPRLPPDFNPDLFAGRLVDNFLTDAFRHGMFHADLHPGNLMIMPGNIVGYIDFGISGVLSSYSRRRLIGLTLAYAQGDLDGMCEAFFQITTFDNNADLAGFRRGLSEISVNWYDSSRKENRLRKSITLMMLDLLVLSRENGIWPQRDVIKYIRSAIAMDGLVKTFAPEMNIGLHLQQVCERHIRQDSLQRLFSSEALAGWCGGATSLLRDGALRAVSVLRFAGADSPVASPRPGRRRKARSISSRILAPAWLAICAVAIFRPGDPIHLSRGTTAMAVAAPCIVLLVAFAVLRGMGGKKSLTEAANR